MDELPAAKVTALGRAQVQRPGRGESSFSMALGSGRPAGFPLAG